MKGIKSELYHYGIKGQKWGVRHGPPYPIENKILKKGTRLNSVSGVYRDSDTYRKNGKWMYTYRPEEEWDNKVYKGPFSKYLVMYRGARFIKEHKFETIKDLKMPNKKERLNEFKKLYESDKDGKTVIEEMESVRKLLVQHKIGSEKEQEQFKNINLKSLESDKDYKVAYAIFNHAMENNQYYKSTKKYVENISKKYDAMVDDNNQGIYNQANDPIIIFRANEVLKSIGNDSVSDYLTIGQIIENTESVREELAKKGINVKL